MMYQQMFQVVVFGSILDCPFEKNEDVIRAIANSKNVSIRFYGRQYYDDRKLSNAKIKALKNMLILYDACKAGYLNK